MKSKIKKIIIFVSIMVGCLGLFIFINKLVKEKQVKQNTTSKVIYLTNDKAVDLVKELVQSAGDTNYNSYSYNIIEENEDYLIVEVSSRYNSVDKYMITYTTDSDGNKELDCINKMAKDSSSKTLKLWIHG